MTLQLNQIQGRQKIKIFAGLLLGLGLSISTVSVQAESSCAGAAAEVVRSDSSKTNEQLARLQDLSRANYGSRAIKAFKAFENALDANPQIKTIDNGRLHTDVIELLSDETQSIYHDTLAELFADLDSSLSGEALKTELKNRLYNILETRMSNATARTRSNSLFSKSRTLKHALGKMTVAEARIELMGSDLAAISPTSILGKYLSAVKNGQERVVSRKLPTKPNSNESSEISRLVAPLVESGQEAFNKYIANNPNILMHFHEESQGTLETLYRRQKASYSRPDSPSDVWVGEDLRIPLIVLSTVEANNVRNYFDLGELNRSRSKTPARLNNQRKGTQYVGNGGAYSCCTHWIGEMPFGEKIVDTYRFPGDVDNHAYNEVGEATGSAPRIFKLGTYNHHSSSNEKIGNSSRVDRLTRMVWREGKGPAQFWEVLGLRDQLDAAELTNPGYVLYSLMGYADRARVPVVLMTPNTNGSLPSNKAIREKIYQY